MPAFNLGNEFAARFQHEFGGDSAAVLLLPGDQAPVADGEGLVSAW
ncbi:hypothetical protein [Luteimonas sp. R10]|nr:hypothetical protein U3649_10570 [Luteimonas sp. R10]